MGFDVANRKYEVVPFDPRWAEDFEIEAMTLRRIFGDLVLAIEHIGSTSVQGMAAKPIIDTLILVSDIAPVDDFNQKMLQAGYQAMGEYVAAGARFFLKERDGVRLFNVHVFPEDHPHVKEMLDVRNYLRTHPEDAKHYGEFKTQLHRKYANDYQRYREEKNVYMKEMMKRLSGHRE